MIKTHVNKSNAEAEIARRKCPHAVADTARRKSSHAVAEIARRQSSHAVAEIARRKSHHSLTSQPPSFHETRSYRNIESRQQETKQGKQ